MAYFPTGEVEYAMGENNFHIINISMPYPKNIAIVGFGQFVSITGSYKLTISGRRFRQEWHSKCTTNNYDIAA